MKTEFVNVLKYDFYSEKILAYHDISVRTINILLQLRAYNIIEEDEFQKNIEFFTGFYISFMSEFNRITYKYQNMMNQIFDNNVGGDERATVLDNYISEDKTKEFNEDIENFESSYFTVQETIVNMLDDMALAKMFLLDFQLLSVLEEEFSYVYNLIETVEVEFGEFEDTIISSEDYEDE